METVSRIQNVGVSPAGEVVDELDFSVAKDYGSTKKKMLPCLLDGKRHVVVECSEDAYVRYRDAAIAASSLGPDGKPIRVDGGLAKIEPQLVADCLYSIGANSKTLYKVHLGEVMKMPPRVVQEVFRDAKEVSGLDKLVGANRQQLELQRKEIDERIKLLDDAEGNGTEPPDESLEGEAKN